LADDALEDGWVEGMSLGMVRTVGMAVGRTLVGVVRALRMVGVVRAVRVARVVVSVRVLHVLAARTAQTSREARAREAAHHLVHHALDVHAARLGVGDDGTVAEFKVAIGILEDGQLDVVELDLLLCDGKDRELD
jgi:hypothetical protein